MRNKPYVTIVLLALLMLCGCQQQVAYHAFCHIDEPGWDKTDTLHFDISPVARDGNYRLDAELRTDKDPSKESFNNKIDCNLISETGVIEGDGISYFQYQFYVRGLSLHQGDSVHISLTHNMKREIMPGISDVGVKLSLPH